MATDHFAGRIAEHYDDAAADMFAPEALEPVLDVLTELAGGGAALEFGIGTGRIALPLHERGVPVHGIDLSVDMLARLRAKPGGPEIPVTVGDFATTRVEGRFSLAYLVFNTIMNLTSQQQQVACFRNAARHLEPGGRFVIEVGVPELRRLPPGESARPFLVSPTRLGFDEFDVSVQRVVSHHYGALDGQLHITSIPFRYVWPAELDLMAQLAGMHLVARWDGWDRSAFTAESRSHVSIWEAPG
jgi:SAM-dependent methyltransferase